MNRFMHYYSRFKNHENSYKVQLKTVISSLSQCCCVYCCVSFLAE